MATQVVIRATESFNLHCKNVARQVEEKMLPVLPDLKAVLVGSRVVRNLKIIKNNRKLIDHAIRNFMQKLGSANPSEIMKQESLTSK